MSSDQRLTGTAALRLELLRASVETIRATIERVAADGEDLAADMPGAEAFRIAWHLATANAGAVKGATAVLIAYTPLATPDWTLRMRAVTSALTVCPDLSVHELLERTGRLLSELEGLLGELDSEVREHAMLALGSGDVISQADLDALLGG